MGGVNLERHAGIVLDRPSDTGTLREVRLHAGMDGNWLIIGWAADRDDEYWERDENYDGVLSLVARDRLLALLNERALPPVEAERREVDPLPPDVMAVLRNPDITLPGELNAIDMVLARGCRACLGAEFPYWHPRDRPCPTSDTPSASPPPESDPKEPRK